MFISKLFRRSVELSNIIHHTDTIEYNDNLCIWIYFRDEIVNNFIAVHRFIARKVEKDYQNA